MLSKSNSRNPTIYITLTNPTTNGIAAKQKRKGITLVDALVIPSALSSSWICLIFNKARYYIVCPFKQGEPLVSKLETVDILYRAGSVKRLLRTSGLIHI